jgi:TonB-dependent starch-binding outer membrane protein SusC
MKARLSILMFLFTVFIGLQSFAQERTVKGTVTDDSGMPLPGVSVLVKGTTTGTETDFDGKFSIKALANQTLVFSMIGMKKQELLASSTSMNVKMKEDAQQIDEVVVIGYGTQKRKEVTGSVSSIKGTAIQNLVTPSFDSQLAGRASGVQVTTNTGIIGEAPRIRIRGISSVSGGTFPLVVIDGVPMFTGDVGGRASTNALADINPNDIETFDILKDGAATAIYGSRGSNGVIIITTKKGKSGHTEVNYNTTVGFASAVKTFDLLETPDFLVISNEKRTNRGQAPWAVGSNFNTDWQKEVLNESALQIDHNLSMSGGTDKVKYFMSIGYTDQDGVAKTNEMNRYSLRTNVEGAINKWLKAGASLSVTRTNNFGLNSGRNSLSGNMFNVMRQLPNVSVFNPNHPTGYNLAGGTLNNSFVGQGQNTDPVGDNISNIVYVLNNNKYESRVNRIIANSFISADIVTGLNYKFQAAADLPSTKGFQYLNPIHGDGEGSRGFLQNDQTDNIRWNIQHLLNYNKTFNDKHNLSLTGVIEYQKDREEIFFGRGRTILDEFYNQHLVSGSYEVQESGGSVIESGLISYIGRASYNYDSKYFIQASIRRDGLSNLDPKTRWTNFLGYSGGWNVSKEKFFEPLTKVVNDLKFRASFAEVGNVNIGNYPYLGLTSAAPYASNNGLGFSQFGNDLLEWEKSSKLGIGVDLGLFNDRLGIIFDYFKDDISDLILRVPIAPSLGVPGTGTAFGTISRNIGAMYNRGFEFGLNFKAIENENFSWNINANLTLIKNEVTSVPDGNDILGGTFTDVNINPNLIIREGESINSIFGFRYWGVNPANGNPVYYKADGSLVQGNLPTQNYRVFNPNNPSDISTPSSLSLTSDRVILGQSLPTYFGGITNSFRYKNFDLNFLVRFSGGNKIFNSTRRELMNMNLNNNGTEILGRWQSPEQQGDGVTPRLWASNNPFVNLSGAASSRFLEDGDFVSIDNIAFGYNFSKKLLDKVNIKGLRLFIQAQNVFVFTKYKGLNPEMETGGVDLNGTPISRVISMGLNVKL